MPLDEESDVSVYVPPKTKKKKQRDPVIVIPLGEEANLSSGRKRKTSDRSPQGDREEEKGEDKRPRIELFGNQSPTNQADASPRWGDGMNDG